MERLSGDGVGEIQNLGTERLSAAARCSGTVLGVAHNGKAHIGAVHPQLVGTAGDGLQSKQGFSVQPFENPVTGKRRFSFFKIHIPEQAGQRPAGDGASMVPLSSAGSPTTSA